jgi:LacI family transcriptional regulator
MATILDVARLAGVSPITVSRVINRSGYFSQQTGQKVEAAIRELGYVPNTLARSLRSKRTNTLALVITDITNPFFTTLARGVEDTASEAGFTVIFCNTDESQEKEDKYLQVVLQKQVDGILLVPAHSSPESIDLIQKHGTPLVVLDRHIPGASVDVVRGDSEGGAYQLTRLLLSLGHRRIAIISGPQVVSTSVDRVGGYQKALQEAGLENNPAYVFYGAFTQDSGYELTCRALALDSPPTALIAANNFLGIGALKALQASGIQVPADFSLASFDDLPQALLISFPFFTVASQAAYEMGRQATQLLLERLEKDHSDAYREIILPCEIIVRASTGPVKE